MRNIDYASKQLNKIRNRISQAAENVGREASSVVLIGAAKQQDAALCEAFCEAGLEALGENFVQQGIERQKVIPRQRVQWHFIGKIQSNKTRLIGQHFDWVHGVDRLKVARRFSDQSAGNSALQILLQLNIDDEASKAGIALNQAPQLCDQVAQLPNLQLRGFMLIPKPNRAGAERRRPFALAREALASVNQRYGLAMDSLSMGMSSDLEDAIAEGATMVRVGTDLFGQRPAHQD
ncbi:MAG: YggS family pyridoxal phosphate-dependent enzyme [Gammaproteobacteria bacterium]|nr:YggS family pyridoxal phosphate-dependent enzyme [Gammaproteobacteria bacterium]